MSETADVTTWAAVEELAGAKLPAKLRAGLAELGEEAVVHLTLPYGEKIIRKNEFQWDLLGPAKAWRDDYGADIPVAIVAKKSVELYDILHHMKAVPDEDHIGRDKHIDVVRSIPLYMVVAGEFFGLFENFTQYRSPLSMRGTAGGTTLVALPPVASTRNVENFLDGVGFKLKEDELKDLVTSIKTTDESKMAVGPFIKSVLAHCHCPWRCEIIVLSPTFVERIRKSERAKEAIMEMLVEQLVVSHQRSDGMLRVATTERGTGGARTDEVHAMHLIADGARPGFAPVICTDNDEEVLPAAFLHDRLFGVEPPEDGVAFDPEKRFPVLLRPALPGEPCFYLMGRPFFNGHVGRRKAPSHRRIKAIFDNLQRKRGALTFRQAEGEKDYPLEALLKALEEREREVYWEARPSALAAWFALYGSSAPWPVKLPDPNSHFMRLGLIGYQPPDPGAKRSPST
jgi:hypothetical protein